MEKPLLPVTAVAEMEYCPRSFWYQVAFGRRKLSNEHIAEGLEQDEARAERSDSPNLIYGVRAFSEELGLIGYLDAVMTEAGELVPVEYKKGKKKESETDKLTLCALAMCIEETTGRVVRRGYLYYTASRTQIEVSFTDVNASSSVMRFFMQEGIDLVFMSAHGRFQGRLQAQSPRNIMLRIAQFQRWRDEAFAQEMCRAFVIGKIRNMRILLQRQLRKLGLAVLKEADDAMAFALRLAERAESKQLLLGIEGTASAAYFKGLAELFSLEGFDFPTRTRRPPLDPANALLSFLYYLLGKDVESALLAAGLDPYLGFYHSLKYGRPALALDLMEEFRPVIADSVALTLIRKRILTPEDFKCTLGVWEIKDGARKKVYRAYEERLNSVAEHPVLGRKYSARRIIEAQARLMAKVIEGDWPRYEPYTIR
ncbi:MAG: CRISPR-associated endonuclease Cas1 [candidate division WOR-3 bacterium]